MGPANMDLLYNIERRCYFKTWLIEIQHSDPGESLQLSLYGGVRPHVSKIDPSAD